MPFSMIPAHFQGPTQELKPNVGICAFRTLHIALQAEEHLPNRDYTPDLEVQA